MSAAHESLFSAEDEKRGLFQRFGFVLGIIGIAAVVGVILVGQSLFKHTPVVRHAPEVTMVKIMTPPPAPPPPPPEQKIVQERMVDQPLMENPEPKPAEQAAPAPNEVGTNIKGEGAGDGFGLSGNGNAGFAVGSRANASAGSGWGWYAGQVQSAISDALRQNPRTRLARFRVVVRVWPDLTGRITRAQLGSSTGDPALDATIREQVLQGLQLREAPPDGMPLPIVMRITAARPN